MSKRSNKKLTLEEARQKFNSGFVPRGPEECWPFTGGHKSKSGHVSISTGSLFKTRSTFAHRLVFLLQGIELPDKSEVCHKCNNPPCVNPSHLYVGNRQTNSADMVKAGRRQGERHPCHKLSDNAVESIKWLDSQDFAQKDIAVIFSCSASVVSRIVRGEYRNKNHSPEERSRVNSLRKGDVWDKPRKIAIWLKSEGFSTVDVAVLLDCHKATVDKWVKRHIHQEYICNA